jgi:hypothetical protein
MPSEYGFFLLTQRVARWPVRPPAGCGRVSRMRSALVLLSVLAAVGCGGPGVTHATKSTTPGDPEGATSDAQRPEAESQHDQSATASLPERVELLGGRLRLSVPAGAKVAPRAVNVMAAAPSDDDETRVIVVPGDGEVARFVLLARELFALGSGSLEGDASKFSGKDAAEMTIARTKVGKGLEAVTLRPKRELGSHGALFVLGALIQRADGTLCQLAFYILPEMSPETAEWEAKALAMLGTLEAGSGALLGATKHELDEGRALSITLELPRPAVRTFQRGPDFFVYRMRELSRVGEDETSLGVYFGGHPSHQWKQAGLDRAKVKTSGAKLLEKQVEWFTWTAEAGKIVSETIVPVGPNAYMHVFASGPKDKVGELRLAAESMRATKKGNRPR